MMNTRLAVAIHILSLAATNPRENVTSDMIAGSVNTNPVVIRRISGVLRKAGLLATSPGVPGSALTKEPSDITLLEIYKAVQNQEYFFPVHEKPNPKCPVGAKIQSTLDVTFDRVQRAMERELESTTLQDIIYHLFE